MNIRTAFKSLAAASLVFASASTVAAPIFDGTYQLTNAGSADTRGIWTNVGRFSTVSGSFSVSGNTAVLEGDVFRSEIGGGLTFSVAMNHLCSSAVSDAGGRNVSVDNVACGLGLQPTGGAVRGADVDGNSWDFWNWGASELTGYGSLAGLTISVSQAPAGGTKPFRVGIGADWDDKYLLGASGWIAINALVCSAGENCESTTFNPRSADFNFRFTPVSEPSVVTLLLLGLGLVGLAQRRRVVAAR